MTILRRTFPLVFAFGLGTALVAGVASAQETAKRPLDHDVYDIWRSIDGHQISHDGERVLYSLVPVKGDAELWVHDLDRRLEHVLERGRSARFTPDARYALFSIKPLHEEVIRASRDGDTAPTDSLGILDTQTGEVTRIARVRSFQLADQLPDELPPGGASWVAYQLEQEPAEEDEPDEAAEESPAAEEPAERRGRTARDGDRGSPLVLRRLDTGEERRFPNVTSYQLAKDGRRLFYVASGDEAENGVFVVDVATGESWPVMTGTGRYRQLAVHDDGDQAVFLSDHADHDADEPAFALYQSRADRRGAADEATRLLATTGTAGIPADWHVSENGALSFSKSGDRVFFNTAPTPPPAPEQVPDDERVVVDVWHWQDGHTMATQAIRADQERRRSYRAVAHLRDGRVVQLANENVPTVNVAQHGDGPLGIGVSDVPYQRENTWDSPNWRDVYFVDVETGEHELLLERTQANVSFSPERRYVAWWDNAEQAWFARDLSRGTGAIAALNLTGQIPNAFHNEDHDSPSPAGPYGSAGWTAGDEHFLVYDRFDVWLLDPAGAAAPRNLTAGYGRQSAIRLRHVQLDPDQDALDPREPILLSAFDLRTKEAGFYRTTLNADEPPRQLLFEPRAFSTPERARDADVLVFTRESYEEFPDLWVSDPEFRDLRRLSEANPQQAEYLWGTAELVEWRSADGIPLHGILYKPEGFRPDRQYPMVVNFYERNSQGLYRHRPPEAHRSSITATFYASRGYLVFVPDIVYRTGYPGESALNAVVSGVLHLLGRDYVDEHRIGVQGHSWGGYQIAYMLTRTNIFRAAIAGAPVANMTSAYGGIRWETGLSRMFQYERTQSRLGASLWETPIRYLENSPLFWADKIETPVLIMHNDKDGHVPWEQGLELFLALRRLGKPSWLINYNDEPHWPTTDANKKDWNIRMQQYFDHFLLDAPPPAWLVHGVPATAKGRTLGLELLHGELVTEGGGNEP